ncbi:MAG: hypothetical protein ACLKAK_12005 [Alkaliphilus sp.]
MMKKIGEYMVDKGFNVELHHCSSDIDSLDGLVFPRLKIAIIDGTAPHIVDPRHPDAVDEIIHPTRLLTTNIKQITAIARLLRVCLNSKLKCFCLFS